MEQKIGYKVLTQSRNSIVQYMSEGGCHYPKGKEVKPHKGCGPLCVFTSCRRAYRFLQRFSAIKLVKCKYKESATKTIWDNTDRREIHLDNLPTHTALADSVTCLE